MGAQAPFRERLAVAPADLEAFCRRWRIAKLEIFGSIVREDFGAESDIDFLVSFDSAANSEEVDWLLLREELSGLVGRKADVLDRRLVERSRNLYRRHHILREAIPIRES